MSIDFGNGLTGRFFDPGEASKKQNKKGIVGLLDDGRKIYKNTKFFDGRNNAPSFTSFNYADAGIGDGQFWYEGSAPTTTMPVPNNPNDPVAGDDGGGTTTGGGGVSKDKKTEVPNPIGDVDFNYNDYFNGSDFTAPDTPEFEDLFGGVDGRAGNAFGSVFDTAMKGSTRSYDTAANRVRDRLQSEYAINRNEAINQGAATGAFGNLGRQLSDSRGQQLGAYGDALVGLEAQREQAALDYLGLANDAARGQSDFDLGVADRELADQGQRNDFLDSIFRTESDNAQFYAGDKTKRGQVAVDAIVKAYGIESGMAEELLRLIFGAAADAPGDNSGYGGLA